MYQFKTIKELHNFINNTQNKEFIPKKIEKKFIFDDDIYVLNVTAPDTFVFLSEDEDSVISFTNTNYDISISFSYID